MRQEQRSGWPRRLTISVGRSIYSTINKSSLSWLVSLPAVQRIRRRIIYTPAWRVITLLDLLAAAGVRVWVAGGWGVDALLDRQTRRHRDIDLVIGDDDATRQQVAQVLAHEDFRFVGAYDFPGIRIPWSHVWHHDAGHTVEVLPVPRNEPPFASVDTAEGGGWQPFTEGRISGRPVPCLSAELQLLLHSGYPPRETDTQDIAQLRAYLELSEQATTE